MPLDISELFLMCPTARHAASDLEVWNTLEGGTDNASAVKVGLFGYDMTCVANYCALQKGDDNYYCPIIEARGLDGLAFGIHFATDAGSISFYCAGFRHEESSDTAFCATLNFSGTNYYWTQSYTVADDYFSGSTVKRNYSESQGYYGLSENRFKSSNDGLITADTNYSSAFRFIGANENGGARWSVGDTIDMFYMDFENEEVTSNDGFELAGAATLTLTAAGIALISAVMM